MDTLEALYTLACSIGDSWQKRESVDWSEAEQLARACGDVPAPLRARLPQICEIASYATALDDWDSCEVGNWPYTIVSEIEDAQPTFHYRDDGDDWEVFALALTGAEEWKATVETEGVAKKVVELFRSEA